VRSSNSTNYDVAANLSYTVVALPATGLTVAPDAGSPSPHLYGTAVTFTATATGGTPTYQFQFNLWQGNTKLYAGTWGPGNTWTMPATQAPGVYTVQVYVRTSSAVPMDLVTQISYTVSAAPATSLTLAPDAASPSPHPTGTAVLFTATASGGGPTYSYQFNLWQGNTKVIAGTWGAGNTWTLPATTVPGNYTVQVYVRTSTTVAYDLVRNIPYSVTP
jgi:hypothetical protein